jgi:signal transduction histidine kinase
MVCSSGFGRSSISLYFILSIARQNGGTGLGLYISKQLVEKMGGRFRVVSKPGKGSTFTLAIAAGLQPEPAERNVSQRSDIAGRRA